MGNPVRHTMSPEIHNTLSEELGRDMVYVAFPVEEDPVEAVRGAYHLGIRGMNVTVPHKLGVIPALVEIDPAAEAIGAVNTLVRVDGGYKGYNTDMPGLGRSLRTKGVTLEGKQVVVLGAGGASRAVCVLALTERAESVYLINRTKEKAQALAEDLLAHFPEGKMIPLSKEEYQLVPEKPTVMIQCTSLGLHEGDGLLIEDRAFYKKAIYGYDLVYNPAVTPFLKLLREMGIPGDNGLSMLLYQGVIAYELWTGETIGEDLVQRVRMKLERRLYGENVLLVGYMGCGKSTVGRKLAEEQGMDFLDMDALIEQEMGCTIRKIFEERGEAGFRELETACLRKLRDTAVHTVIATGGGAVLRKENRELMKDAGQVIWLQASEKTTFDRVKSDRNRPLLDAGGEEALRQKIHTMLETRRASYDAAADRVVTVDGKTVEMIAAEISK
ncbi:MAG: shikimate dehydrogenase [Eubacterium sp.]|nr:shikimate dehydrogenase [Eubacterium sp.]